MSNDFFERFSSTSFERCFDRVGDLIRFVASQLSLGHAHTEHKAMLFVLLRTNLGFETVPARSPFQSHN